MTTYTLYKKTNCGVSVADDSITIDNFLEWIQDTKEWNEFIEENHYSVTYGIRKLRHFLRQSEVSGDTFKWKNFEFIKNLTF